MQPVGWYREFVPCKALQEHIYALFSFVPGPVTVAADRSLVREIAFPDTAFCSPQFADGHVSMVFELGRTCDADGRWCADSNGLRGTVTGPMSRVGRTEDGDRPEMIGAYFRPARVAPFLHVPISDLTDHVIFIDDLWGTAGARLADELSDLGEPARIDRFESVLLAHLGHDRRRKRPLDVERLAAAVLRRKGRVTVEGMARAAGVSRQHLSREFRERLGVTPKLYCRLARFQSGLVYAGCQATVDWARVAVEMGYADQSHMIAEFKQFSGLTPHTLATRAWFHPFIERAKSAPL